MRLRSCSWWKYKLSPPLYLCMIESSLKITNIQRDKVTLLFEGSTVWVYCQCLWTHAHFHWCFPHCWALYCTCWIISRNVAKESGRWQRLQMHWYLQKELQTHNLKSLNALVIFPGTGSNFLVESCRRRHWSRVSITWLVQYLWP